jgi:hypothetical protein
MWASSFATARPAARGCLGLGTIERGSKEFGSARAAAVLQGTEGVDRVGVRGFFVRSVALDPGEAQRHPVRVASGGLDA